MKDAIGQDLEIGKIYGYSRNQNGITHTFTGILKNTTDLGVNLEILSRFKAIYSDDVKPDKINKKIVNCKSNMIFKLN